MATNWSNLAKQFLDKMKPSGDEPSDSGSSSASTSSDSSDTSSAAADSTTVDIARQQIGGVYAKALLAAAGKNASSAVGELGGFAKMVREMPQLQHLLDSPRVSAEEKIGILDRSLKGRVSPVILNFLKVVSEHERLDCLQDIHAEAKRLQHEADGIVQVVVTTAEAIDSGELSRIKKDLEKKIGSKVAIETAVDPSIIGGVVIRMGDQVFDGSVSQRLTSIRSDAVTKAVEKMRAATDTFATETSS